MGDPGRRRCWGDRKAAVCVGVGVRMRVCLCASLVSVGRMGPYEVEEFCVCVLAFVCHGFWKFYVSKKRRSFYLHLWGSYLFLLLQREGKISIFAGVVGPPVVFGFLFLGREPPSENYSLLPCAPPTLPGQPGWGLAGQWGRQQVVRGEGRGGPGARPSACSPARVC